MSRKVTPWFAGRVRPFRKGLYEVQYPERHHTDFRLWDGRDWLMADGEAISLFGVNPYDKWRGLAKEPR